MPIELKVVATKTIFLLCKTGLVTVEASSKQVIKKMLIFQLNSLVINLTLYSLFLLVLWIDELIFDDEHICSALWQWVYWESDNPKITKIQSWSFKLLAHVLKIHPEWTQVDYVVKIASMKDWKKLSFVWQRETMEIVWKSMSIDDQWCREKIKVAIMAWDFCPLNDCLEFLTCSFHGCEQRFDLAPLFIKLWWKMRREIKSLKLPVLGFVFSLPINEETLEMVRYFDNDPSPVTLTFVEEYFALVIAKKQSMGSFIQRQDVCNKLVEAHLVDKLIENGFWECLFYISKWPAHREGIIEYVAQFLDHMAATEKVDDLVHAILSNYKMKLDSVNILFRPKLMPLLTQEEWLWFLVHSHVARKWLIESNQIPQLARMSATQSAAMSVLIRIVNDHTFQFFNCKGISSCVSAFVATLQYEPDNDLWSNFFKGFKPCIESDVIQDRSFQCCKRGPDQVREHRLMLSLLNGFISPDNWTYEDACVYEMIYRSRTKPIDLTPVFEPITYETTFENDIKFRINDRLLSASTKLLSLVSQFFSSLFTREFAEYGESVIPLYDVSYENVFLFFYILANPQNIVHLTLEATLNCLDLCDRYIVLECVKGNLICQAIKCLRIESPLVILTAPRHFGLENLGRHVLFSRWSVFFSEALAHGIQIED